MKINVLYQKRASQDLVFPFQGQTPRIGSYRQRLNVADTFIQSDPCMLVRDFAPKSRVKNMEIKK